VSSPRMGTSMPLIDPSADRIKGTPAQSRGFSAAC
jgi:hypothetical protein